MWDCHRLRDVTTMLALADGWTETAHAAGTYGPDDTSGLAATFERDSMATRVLPVRYDCSAGVETLRGLTDEVRLRREGAVSPTATADRKTAFATIAAYDAPGGRERAPVCVAADAGDALAVALWLTATADTDRDLRRALTVREGGGGATVTDDDALEAAFADRPERCLGTGRPTRSHEVRVPYRYYPLLEGAKRNRGVPRVPNTVRSLVGVVSHTVWEDRGLGEIALDAPVERVAPGEYRRGPAVTTLLDGTPVADLALQRLVER